MKIDLTSKIAVVTGATGDLGRVITRTLAACGASVAIHYFKNEKLARQLQRDIEQDGSRAIIVQADVTQADSVQAMHGRIAEALGEPDIIINNAVIQYAWKSVLEQTEADFIGQFQSCVLHNLNMVKAFVPAMMARGRGRVIAMNTECTLQCWPTQGAYVTGKQGMSALLMTLAKEVGPHGVTVNQIAPGWIFSDRDRTRHAAAPELQKVIDDYSRMIPLKRRGDDQEIANLTAFLASDLAGYITGALIPVNGGGPTIPPWLSA